MAQAFDIKTKGYTGAPTSGDATLETKPILMKKVVGKNLAIK
jgi:hypothetical protein